MESKAEFTRIYAMVSVEYDSQYYAEVPSVGKISSIIVNCSTALTLTFEYDVSLRGDNFGNLKQLELLCERMTYAFSFVLLEKTGGRINFYGMNYFFSMSALNIILRLLIMRIILWRMWHLPMVDESFRLARSRAYTLSNTEVRKRTKIIKNLQ